MLKPINHSPFLARLLEGLSAWLAKRRGLPTVIGVLLIVVSFVFSVIGIYAPSQTLDLLWSITHHLGLIIALIGLLLVQPLGS